MLKKKKMRQVYDTLSNLIYEYNTRHKKHYVLGEFDSCQVPYSKQVFRVPFRGISNMMYGEVVQFIGNYYPGVDICYETSTKYQDEHYIIIPVRYVLEDGTEEEIMRSKYQKNTCYHAFVCIIVLLLVVITFVSIVVIIDKSRDSVRNAEKYESATSEFGFDAKIGPDGSYLKFSDTQNESQEEDEEQTFLYNTGKKIMGSFIRVFYSDKAHHNTDKTEYGNKFGNVDSSVAKDIHEMYKNKEL